MSSCARCAQLLEEVVVVDLDPLVEDAALVVVGKMSIRSKTTWWPLGGSEPTGDCVNSRPARTAGDGAAPVVSFAVEGGYGSRETRSRTLPSRCFPAGALQPIVNGPRDASRRDPWSELEGAEPLGSGYFEEAADGTRTHDLLHGKQTL
jgi:hypothetical protein